jgi:hypothetical protein
MSTGDLNSLASSSLFLSDFSLQTGTLGAAARRCLFLMLAFFASLCIDFQQAVAEGLELQSVVRVPHSRNDPGGVLVLQATLVNKTDTVREGTLLSTVDGVQTDQSARRVTVAPKSSATTDLVVPVPESIAGKDLVEIKTVLYSRSGGVEVVETNGGRPEEYTFNLAPDSIPTFAALFMDPEPAPVPPFIWPQPSPSMSYEYSIASRVDSGNSRRVANFSDRELPLSFSDWESIDTAMIANRNVLEDAAFVYGLKKFITGGGKAWVMLDRIPSELLRPLLGPDQLCETVDSVELNEFVVEVIGGEIPLSEADRTVYSMSPLKMKRVFQHGGRVSHRVDGWPIAIWMPIGYGQLLITTLDPAGWVKVRENQIVDKKFDTRFESQAWAGVVAEDVNSKTLDKPLASETEYPLKQLGNPVVPKSWVATALSCFCILLAAIGGWRVFAGDLSLLGVIAPAVALCVAIGLVVASTFVRGDQQESVAKLQLIQVSEDGTTALVRERSAVYLQGAADMRLQGPIDGRAELSGPMESGIRRFELTDFQSWELANTAWPAGIWRYSSDYTLPCEQLSVNASFTEAGLDLDVPALPGGFEDAVLNYSLGGPMICRPSGDKFVVNADQPPAGDRWIEGALISTEQQRRLEIYQQFFTPNDRVKGLSKVLYGWTNPWDGGPRWSKELQTKGAALVALPVKLNRPAVGQKFVIPHGLVRVQTDQSEVGSTFAFSDVTGTWAPDLTMAVAARVQLVLPREVLPFQADVVNLELDIKAPQRKVKVSVLTESGPVEVADLNSPSIPWSGAVTDSKVLQDAEDGVLTVLIDVGEKANAGGGSSSVVSWNIENFQASFRGEVRSE